MQDILSEEAQQTLAGLPAVEQLLRWVLKRNPRDRPTVHELSARRDPAPWLSVRASTRAALFAQLPNKCQSLGRFSLRQWRCMCLSTTCEAPAEML